jgi:DNA-binding NtrC family response regulator
MADKVLCVDDDANILAAYRRSLRKVFDLSTAESGMEGIDVIKNKGPFAVVISDMQMPGLDGISFLAQVKLFQPRDYSNYAYRTGRSQRSNECCQ